MQSSVSFASGHRSVLAIDVSEQGQHNSSLFRCKLLQGQAFSCQESYKVGQPSRGISCGISSIVPIVPPAIVCQCNTWDILCVCGS